MGTKLSSAPLYYTVAQVQFNPVLDLDGYIPAIQSKMRETHFSDYKKEVVQRLVFPFGNAEQDQMAAPTVASQSRYLFGDIDGRSSFMLETNTLSFQTTRYDTFETFSETLLGGLRILHNALGLDFVERIGLRYDLRNVFDLARYLFPTPPVPQRVRRRVWYPSLPRPARRATGPFLRLQSPVDGASCAVRPLFRWRCESGDPAQRTGRMPSSTAWT